MAICKDCLHYDICGNKKCNFMTEETIKNGLDFPCADFKDKTRFVELGEVKNYYDSIRAMTVEEMAKFIFALGNGREYCRGHCAYQYEDNCPNDGGKACLKGVILWLESEVREK